MTAARQSDEPELHLGPKPDKVVPDVAGWRRERMADARGPEAAPAYYDTTPDWICEILSPASEAVDGGNKMRIYHIARARAFARRPCRTRSGQTAPSARPAGPPRSGLPRA